MSLMGSKVLLSVDRSLFLGGGVGRDRAWCISFRAVATFARSTQCYVKNAIATRCMHWQSFFCNWHLVHL